MKLKFYKKEIIRILCILVGSFVMAANIKIFVRAGNTFPGGFSGLTVLIQRIFSEFFSIQLPYSLINYSLNIFPAFIGFKMIGKKFTLYSILEIVLAGAFVDLIPEVAITYDPLLIAVFGGIINGSGIGIILRGGASTGGTDFIGVFISERLHQNSWNYIFGFNCIMLLVAGILFGWEASLYSIIFQFSSTQMVNTLHTRYKKVTLNIMTTKADEIDQKILKLTHHGVTRFEGVGCYLKEDVSMLYTVVAQEQLKQVMHLVHEIDPHAFINVMDTLAVQGRFHQEPID